MGIHNVSFGSLMVFTLNNSTHKANLPSIVRMSFKTNSQLKDYSLCDTVSFSEKIDGTVHNAAKNFASGLDNLYKKELPKGSKQVKLTEVDFYVNPRDTEKRYFLTAATAEDENKIHSVLSKSGIFYTAKFNNKK